MLYDTNCLGSRLVWNKLAVSLTERRRSRNGIGSSW